MAGYAVEFTPAAERQFAKLPSVARTLVAAVLVTLAINPRPHGCVKLAGADDLWRVRVRQYRVVYRVLDRRLLVTVVKIADRKDVYR
jgi:mRNA interferase RelE/StbE